MYTDTETLENSNQSLDSNLIQNAEADEFYSFNIIALLLFGIHIVWIRQSGFWNSAIDAGLN
jgi:hypothetical protein